MRSCTYETLEFAVEFIRTKATVIAALFLLMQLVSPPGMMVSSGEDGFEIVICTAQGMKTVLLDEQGNEIQQSEDDDESSNSCAFASVVAKALSSLPALKLGSSAFPIRTASLPETAQPAGRTVRTGNPRAPPV